MLGTLGRTRGMPGDATSIVDADPELADLLSREELEQARRETLGRRCIELMGPGDVLRPWAWDAEGSHVQAEVGWRALDATSLAVLDHGVVERIAPWPQLGVELFSRGTRR